MTNYDELSDEQLDALYEKAMKKKADLKKASIRAEIEAGFDPDELRHVTNEQHPDISLLDRLGAKWLSRSPESRLESFRNKKPDLDFILDEKTKKVLAKSKDSDKWTYADPPLLTTPNAGPINRGLDQLINLVRDPSDLLDVGGDVVKGGIDGVGTALGGIGGFFAGGVGAVPGAMASGAVTSAGTETARQYLAKKLGYEKNFDAMRIGGEALLGGVLPGGLGAPVIKKALPKLVDTFGGQAVNAYEQSARGFVRRGADKFTQGVAPYIGAAFNSSDPETLKWVARNLDKIREEGKKTAPGSDLAIDTFNKVQGRASKRADEIAKATEETIENNPISIDFAKEGIEDNYKSLAKSYGGYADEILADAKKLGDVEITEAAKVGKAAMDEAIKKNQPLAKFIKDNPKIPKKRLKDAENAIAKNISEAEKVGAEALKVAEKKSKDILKGHKNKKDYKNNQKLLKKINEFSATSKPKDFHDIKRYKRNNKELSNIHRSKDYNPNDPVLADLQTATKQINSKLRDTIETLPGGPEINKRQAEWEQFYNTKDIIKDHFATPEKTQSTLLNLGSRARVTRNKAVNDTQEYLGDINIPELSTEAKAYRDFVKPVWRPVSRGGTTSSSQTIAGAVFGDALGADSKYNSVIGQTIFSDGSILKQIQANDLLKKGAAKVTAPLQQVIKDSLNNSGHPTNPWSLGLFDKKEKN